MKEGEVLSYIIESRERLKGKVLIHLEVFSCLRGYTLLPMEIVACGISHVHGVYACLLHAFLTCYCPLGNYSKFIKLFNTIYKTICRMRNF